MNALTVGSLFSGIGGIDLGLERAGMRVLWQCERDDFCRRVLARHWAGVPCFDDVRGVHADAVRKLGRGRQADRVLGAAGSGGRAARAHWQQGTVDLLCGGFPCQDLSVAGRRAGLTDGERSSLFFEFARIAGDLVRPGGWVLIENVPGLLSSNGGRDFALVLATLAELGFHDLAWRVLDSRYFGVPQRRRRVFIVGRRASGTGAREVLLEPESGGGDFAPSREKGTRVAASLSRGSSGPGVSAPGRRQEDDENIVNALDRQGDATDCLISAPAYPDRMRATSGLPGWVDDPQPDGPRYAATGNAVTVTVSEWIGWRIVIYESELRAMSAA